jgi:FAD/FMN-containing dehydrogenase
MHLYAINGAAHRVDGEDTAFAYRHATFAPVYIAAWPDSSIDEARINWVRDYYEATAPHSEPGGYINFMQDDDQGRIQDNYLGNYARLVDVKRKYDPDNLFRDNQNIKP